MTPHNSEDSWRLVCGPERTSPTKRIGNSIRAAAVATAVACGENSVPAPTPPLMKAVTVQAPALTPNPVVQGRGFSAAVFGSAENTSVDSIVVSYNGGTRQKVTGAIGTTSFTAGTSGQVCATAYATGASPSAPRCSALAVSPISLSIDGTLPTQAPTINSQFPVSANASAQNTTVDSLDAVYTWSIGGRADSARLVARGASTLSGSLTARRAGNLRFRAFSNDAPTATQTKTISVNVPIVLELRAFYRKHLGGDHYEGGVNQAANAVTDSVDKSATTATIAGQSVTTNDGFLRGVAPFGTATVADVRSRDRFQSERYVQRNANGDSALTFTYAPRKPSTTFTIDENALVGDTARIRVYRIPSNTSGDRLNTANWPRYDAVWGTKPENIYPDLAGVHTVPTFSRPTIVLADADVTDQLDPYCGPNDTLATKLMREAAEITRAEFQASDYSIDIVLGKPALVPDPFTGARPADGVRFGCQVNTTDTFASNGTYRGTSQRILASIARGPPGPKNATDTLTANWSVRLTNMDELFEFHAGAFAEDQQNRGGWFDRIRLKNELTAFERDVVRIVNNFFARGVQRIREAQAAAGQTVQPGYRLELPAGAGASSFFAPTPSDFPVPGVPVRVERERTRSVWSLASRPD